MNKACTKCGETKPLTEFHRNLAARDGHQWHCRSCDAALSRRRRAADRERYLERTRVWKAENPKRLSEYRRRYNDAHREQSAEQARAWHAANLDRATENKRRRRARIQSGAVEGARFTIGQLNARLSMFTGCWMCGQPAAEVDHVKPLAKGGLHILANLRPACRRCNAGKRDRWPLEVA